MLVSKKNKRINKNLGKKAKTSNLSRDTGQTIARVQRSLQPPAYRATPIWQFKRRYVATAAVSGNLGINSILNSAIVATSAVLANSLHEAVRIKSLAVWAPVQTSGSSVTVELTPVGADAGNNSFVDLPSSITDTSISFDRPAYVRLEPSVDTPLGSWHLSTAVNLALLNVIAPLGSTMDIVYESVLAFATPQLGFTTVIAGGTPGTIYCRAAVGAFVPVGINNI